MNPPNYFLVDLPAEAELAPGLITEACQTLKRNRARYLETRSTESMIRLLDRLAKEWLSDSFSFRREALDAGPERTGFSREVLSAGLDQFFQQLTEENLEGFLRQELGHPHRLDGFHADDHKRSAIALGPNLLAHIVPGNIPIPAISSMVFGLLTRSAQFIKCATGAAFVPRLFAHSLYEADAKAGACLEIAEWKGGREPLESALFAEADCVTATGSDEMLAAIAKKIPRTARLTGYGTRVSFGYITRESLEQNAGQVAHKAAADITAWNQRGCLSPHVLYVEDGGKVGAEDFAGLLVARLDAVERTFPRGPLPAREAASIATRRSFYEVRAAHSPETKMWASPESTAWTVIFENDPLFQLSCQNRFIYVKAVGNLEQALQGAELARDQISTVGVSSISSQARELASRLARWGARRICPLGQMQNPPLGWRHDGRPALAGLVTWVDWEK